MNPAYDKFNGVESIEFELGGGYEFDTLMFFADSRGVYTAQDSGCSCPTPFEYYEGPSWEAVRDKMERIGSREHAMRIFDAWNDLHSGEWTNKLSSTDRFRFVSWLDAHAKMLP